MHPRTKWYGRTHRSTNVMNQSAWLNAEPKLAYTLRSAPCFRHGRLLSEYDAVLRSTLQSVLNIAMSDESWDQATLPVANGGLGIRKATDIALPAFLSSGLKLSSISFCHNNYTAYLAQMNRHLMPQCPSGSLEQTHLRSSLHLLQHRRSGTCQW